MNTETGFDIDWEAEKVVEVDPEKFYQIYDEKLAAARERLRQDPHYCLIAGLPAPR